MMSCAVVDLMLNNWDVWVYVPPELKLCSYRGQYGHDSLVLQSEVWLIAYKHA